VRRPLATAAAALLMTWGVPTAQAYVSASRFDDPAVDGGGGGRHFTGSPSDGYTCAVCHTGGERPEVGVIGLPSDGYVPGTTYDLEVTLPTAAVSAMALELTDAMGRRAGAVALPPEPALDERCEGGAGEVAGHAMTLPDDRQIIAMDACGASALRATWSAPPESVGPVWFTAIVVMGDASADPTGDGVRELSVLMPIRGGSAEAAQVGSACSAGGAPGAHWGAWTLLILLLLRRRRH